ncbi:MAG TPA: hypothetical protein VGN35_08905 [Jatrophihabitantaceae bacterium]|nr:hypothetical protein [Jatrophihabitantaceae bacterium]
MTRDGFGRLSRAQLAVLVPELLLAGQLIDRSALAYVLAEFGADGMRDIAIDEWMGASPVYTKRMQRALGFEGDDVVTIFKGLQLDIGAPPQFMDFRFTVDDRNHGQFHLDHCGALMDVEPMGEAYVRRMCHDIEDPTFDATAVATNPRAQMRPIHRPPRTPAGRTPHCAWTVTIDDAHEPVAWPAAALFLRDCEAGRFVGVTAIDPDEEGDGDYRGPLVADVRFADFSHSALVRIAEEVCLQMHLLNLSFLLAVRARTDAGTAIRLARKGFTGIAGLAAARIRDALQLGDDLDSAATLLSIHPAFNPQSYVDLRIDRSDGLRLSLDRHTGAERDGAWAALLDADHLEPLQAILRAVDPHLRAVVEAASPDALQVTVVRDDHAHDEAGEVSVTRISSGASFAFADRGDRRELPLLRS